MMSIGAFGNIIRFVPYRSFMPLDVMFEIVDVNELDVELVTKVLDVLELVFCEGLLAHFL
jgi:hypothetical protein